MLLVNFKNELYNYLVSFIFGGLFVTLIYYIVKTINDPVLAAIVAFFPIGLLSCFVMPTRHVLTKYMHNGCYVILLTLLVILGGFLLVKHYNYPVTILVLTMFVWFYVQYIYYINRGKLGVN